MNRFAFPSATIGSKPPTGVLSKGPSSISEKGADRKQVVQPVVHSVLNPVQLDTIKSQRTSSQPRAMIPSLLPANASTQLKKIQGLAPSVGFSNEFDEFVEETIGNDIPKATESFIGKKLDATKVVYWEDIESLQVLFSPSYNLVTNRAHGLAGFCFFSRSVVIIDEPSKHQQYFKQVDSQVYSQDAPTLLFPLWDYEDNLCAIVEVIKNAPFTENDEAFVNYFSSKFRIYSRWFLPQKLSEDHLLSLYKFSPYNSMYDELSQHIANIFDCRSCEVWSQKNKGENCELIKHGHSETLLPTTEAGIVAGLFAQDNFLNIQINQTQQSYNERIDGSNKEAVFGISFNDDKEKIKYAILLRGPKERAVFDPNDINELIRLIPFIKNILSNSAHQQQDYSLVPSPSVEDDLLNTIPEEYRNNYVVPDSLLLEESHANAVLKLEFFSMDWNRLDQVKVLFHIFNYFDLFNHFNISNEMFFRFIYTVRATYNDVPYHNWTHACDVTQYSAYQLTSAKLDQLFKPLEILCLLISSICHDANHHGFNNVYNEKAKTPLGLLYKDSSIMETHHCDQTITILQRDDCNLLHSLNTEEYTRAWSMIIQMILATDMAHHFDIVNKATEKAENYDFEDEENRILALRLLIKVSDISNVSRPFDIADKWCDILCEEFFRQGDMEKDLGIGLTSQLNDRELTNKPKSQIGFYTYVCLPLFNIVAKIFPALSTIADNVQKNLQIWKSLDK